MTDPLSEPGLSSFDVLDGTDITYRQLHHWLQQKAVRPTVSRQTASRMYPQWSRQDRHRILILSDVLDDLAELGVPKIPHVFVRRMWKALIADQDVVNVGRVSIKLCGRGGDQ